MSDPIAVVGRKSSPIMVTLKEYEGKRSIDIRRYYTSNATDELLPTPKGISLDYDAFCIVAKALDEQFERIAGWLDSSPQAQDVFTSSRAAENARSQARPHRDEFSRWKAPTFFEVAGEGGADRISFNREHPFTLAFEELMNTLPADKGVEVLRQVSAMLISYHRAKLLLDGSSHIKPQQLFELVEMNWGFILKHYFNGTNVNE